MCGFAGAVSPSPRPPVEERVLVAMRDALVHRGPDDQGLHLGPGVALGSRRLSIVDLSERGRMPMSSPDGRWHIVYNGEVYNFRDLRKDLEARGHVFHSGTDTEVVLASYIADGPDALARMNGMFAIAIWDAREKKLFLARDRLGIKPLYHARLGDALLFASEPKALVAGGVPAEFDHATWPELLCFRAVAGERTVLKGIERLLPGHWLRWKAGAIQVRRWWRLDERAAVRRADLPKDPVAWYRETFDSAVDLRRISDVPVGVMLSGGLDSSAVAASLALQAGKGVETFTVGFDEAGFDESPRARELAARYKLEAHVLKIPRHALVEQLRRASWLLDEPLAHTNDTHMLALAAYAKPRVTVLLSGEGADETLNGYVRYQPLRFPRLLAAGRPLLKRAAGVGKLPPRARKLARFLGLGSEEALVLYNTCDTLPPELAALGLPPGEAPAYRRAVLDEARRAYPGDLLRQAMYNDQHTFLCSLLDRNDRMTMGASIECRVPFLDYRIVETLAALPTRSLLRWGQRKALARAALGARLPDSINRARKWGFGVPWMDYLRTEPELRAIVEGLPDAAPISGGPLERARVAGLVRGFLAGAPVNESLVKSLVMIAIWHDSYVKPAAHRAEAA